MSAFGNWYLRAGEIEYVIQSSVERIISLTRFFEQCEIIFIWTKYCNALPLVYPNFSKQQAAVLGNPQLLEPHY